MSSSHPHYLSCIYSSHALMVHWHNQTDRDEERKELWDDYSGWKKRRVIFFTHCTLHSLLFLLPGPTGGGGIIPSSPVPSVPATPHRLQDYAEGQFCKILFRCKTSIVVRTSPTVSRTKGSANRRRRNYSVVPSSFSSCHPAHVTRLRGGTVLQNSV